MRRPRLLFLTLIAVVAALLTTAFTGQASAATNPSAGPFPPGANLPGCRSAAHPLPVVLVHGTFEDAAQNWWTLSPYLKNLGYCVYALNYGNRATGDIRQSAHQLSSFVNYVLADSGAKKVDIVGHSQGGLMPRFYINNLGGAGKVDKLIGLAPSNHGTTNALAPKAQNCQACRQQVYESWFIHLVNDNGETRSGVYYTVVETKYDEVVTPYTSAFLHGPSSRVTNFTLQNKCPADTDDHIAVAYDPVVFQFITHALTRGQHPANPGFQPVCV